MDKQAKAYLLRHHQFYHYKKLLVQTFFVATQPLWDKWECVSNLSSAFSLTSGKLKSLISILCCFSSYLNLSLRLTARMTTGDEFSYGNLGRARSFGSYAWDWLGLVSNCNMGLLGICASFIRHLHISHNAPRYSSRYSSGPAWGRLLVGRNIGL